MDFEKEELSVAAEMKAFLPQDWSTEWDINSIVGGDVQIASATIFNRVQEVQTHHTLLGFGAACPNEDRGFDECP